MRRIENASRISLSTPIARCDNTMTTPKTTDAAKEIADKIQRNLDRINPEWCMTFAEIAQNVIDRETAARDATITDLKGKIAQLRKAHNISLREIARSMEFSAPFVSDLERGRRNWNAKLAMDYMKAETGAFIALIARAQANAHKVVLHIGKSLPVAKG